MVQLRPLAMDTMSYSYGADDRRYPAAELVQKIQAFVYPRRVRVKDFFKDYDTLHTGRCTKVQFGRAVRFGGYILSAADLELLASRYKVGEDPNLVRYDLFSDEIETVFMQGSPQSSRGGWSPASTSQGFASPRELGDSAGQLAQVLRRLAKLCRTRGVNLKSCFAESQEGWGSASATRVTPRMSGKVTASQFRRLFPFTKEVTEAELTLITESFRTETGDINYGALHSEVSESNDVTESEFRTSGLVLKPDTATWTHHSLNPVEKIQAKVVEKRIRLYDYFQDFDALRKGFCQVGQLKCVFAILNLDKVINQNDFQTLFQQYRRLDGMFCYADFCADVDRAFTVPGLEKQPLAITGGMAVAPASARRNRMALSDDTLQKVAQLEEQIRYRMCIRRVDLKTQFQDMDKTRRGHITRNQFARVMSMLSFELDQKSIELLSCVYCDLGNRIDFNYLDFCVSCDTAETDIVKQGFQQRTLAPPALEQHPTSKYFDSRGFVRAKESAIGWSRFSN